MVRLRFILHRNRTRMRVTADDVVFPFLLECAWFVVCWYVTRKQKSDEVSNGMSGEAGSRENWPKCLNFDHIWQKFRMKVTKMVWGHKF